MLDCSFDRSQSHLCHGPRKPIQDKSHAAFWPLDCIANESYYYLVAHKLPFFHDFLCLHNEVSFHLRSRAPEFSLLLIGQHRQALPPCPEESRQPRLPGACRRSPDDISSAVPSAWVPVFLSRIQEGLSPPTQRKEGGSLARIPTR